MKVSNSFCDLLLLFVAQWAAMENFIERHVHIDIAYLEDQLMRVSLDYKRMNGLTRVRVIANLKIRV